MVFKILSQLIRPETDAALDSLVDQEEREINKKKVKLNVRAQVKAMEIKTMGLWIYFKNNFFL